MCVCVCVCVCVLINIPDTLRVIYLRLRDVILILYVRCGAFYSGCQSYIYIYIYRLASPTRSPDPHIVTDLPPP